MTNCRHLSICPWIPVSRTGMTRKGHWDLVFFPSKTLSFNIKPYTYQT
ncbi:MULTISPECIES: hypothetical protein [unclassified Wolbachia]|nr:hypothetical protein [Wolbachia endosymbiont (group A) of Apoderus coryli]